MKKVLFVCDGDNYSHEAFEFIKQLQQHEPLFVKGLFFSTLEIKELLYAGYPLNNDPGLQDTERGIPPQVVERFINQCKTNQIRYLAKEHSGFSWSRAFWEKESRFADLLIISQKMLCHNIDAQQPNTYMLELLRWVGCPVWAVPEKATRIEQIIGAYDGSPECMHALAAFCSIFPWHLHLPTCFVYIKNEDRAEIPDLELLEEYVNAHFTDAEIQQLHGDPDQLFTTWIACHKNPVIITGSFGRSAVSNFLQKSFSGQLIGEQIAPLFIAR
ncbi:hypothetical protein [Niabella drilacis]|uniref:Universal stress protein family protein n=1 Tax=Niabella drilacis (strain DSM 25811 / CCM 8410 / CCUG 62505 / LMG 26954 / E90) TaxID=1285928 RepID=A0A1G6RBQ9_NIADE|nr:hypothetical protein [Niabella drilacis]SDD01978.1 hypothetical protein SAMN04487894_105223 [Niabella drilacis]